MLLPLCLKSFSDSPLPSNAFKKLPFVRPLIFCPLSEMHPFLEPSEGLASLEEPFTFVYYHFHRFLSHARFLVPVHPSWLSSGAPESFLTSQTWPLLPWSMFSIPLLTVLAPLLHHLVICPSLYELFRGKNLALYMTKTLNSSLKCNEWSPPWRVPRPFQSNMISPTLTQSQSYQAYYHKQLENLFKKKHRYQRPDSRGFSSDGSRNEHF